MICRDCGGRTCITCDIQWHPEISCAEITARRAEQRHSEETAAEEYLTTNSKLCPKCHVRGQKVDGCDHLTCKIFPPSVTTNSLMSYLSLLNTGPRCQHQYCWVCLADFLDIRRQGNHMHDPACRYHTDNLASTLSGETPRTAQTVAPPDPNIPRRTPYIHPGTVERIRLRRLWGEDAGTQNIRTRRHRARRIPASRDHLPRANRNSHITFKEARAAEKEARALYNSRPRPSIPQQG